LPVPHGGRAQFCSRPGLRWAGYFFAYLTKQRRTDMDATTAYWLGVWSGLLPLWALLWLMR